MADATTGKKSKKSSKKSSSSSKGRRQSKKGKTVVSPSAPTFHGNYGYTATYPQLETPSSSKGGTSSSSSSSSSGVPEGSSSSPAITITHHNTTNNNNQSGGVTASTSSSGLLVSTSKLKGEGEGDTKKAGSYTSTHNNTTTTTTSSSHSTTTSSSPPKKTTVISSPSNNPHRVSDDDDDDDDTQFESFPGSDDELGSGGAKDYLCDPRHSPPESPFTTDEWLFGGNNHNNTGHHHPSEGDQHDHHNSLKSQHQSLRSQSGNLGHNGNPSKTVSIAPGSLGSRLSDPPPPLSPGGGAGSEQDNIYKPRPSTSAMNPFKRQMHDLLNSIMAKYSSSDDECFEEESDPPGADLIASMDNLRDVLQQIGKNESPKPSDVHLLRSFAEGLLNLANSFS